MATEPKRPAAAGKASGRTTKAAPAASKGPDLKAIETRISALESGLKSAERTLEQRAGALEARINSMEKGGSSGQTVRLPEGVPDGIQKGLDRAADLVRHNPITALILIVTFLLVAIFN